MTCAICGSLTSNTKYPVCADNECKVKFWMPNTDGTYAIPMWTEKKLEEFLKALTPLRP